MVETSKETARARADSRFKKAEEASSVRQKAVAEQNAEHEARRVKTNKLRDLRLAKEAADLAELAANPPQPKKRAKAAKPVKA